MNEEKKKGNHIKLIIFVAIIIAILVLNHIFGWSKYIGNINNLKMLDDMVDNNLPVALAIASSYRDVPIADDLVAIGEVGLTGEIRAVSHLSQRLGEVSRLGFTKCMIPRSGSEKVEIPKGLTVYRVRNLREAIEVVLA